MSWPRAVAGSLCRTPLICASVSSLLCRRLARNVFRSMVRWAFMFRSSEEFRGEPSRCTQAIKKNRCLAECLRGAEPLLLEDKTFIHAKSFSLFLESAHSFEDVTIPLADGRASGVGYERSMMEETVVVNRCRVYCGHVQKKDFMSRFVRSLPLDRLTVCVTLVPDSHKLLHHSYETSP